MDNDRAKQLLEERRDDLEQVVRAAIEQGSLESEQSEVSGELSSADQHPADAATDTVEREVNVSVREGAEASLRDVERALERLDAGTYGTCPVCESEIPDDRLEAKPEAEFCVDHQPSATPLPEE